MAEFDEDPAPEEDASALWRAVIGQAGRDLTDYRAKVRADAWDFFNGPRLLVVLAVAGCDTAIAPVIRAYARQRVAEYRAGSAAQGEHIRHVIRGSSRSCRSTVRANSDARVARRVRIAAPVAGNGVDNPP